MRVGHMRRVDATGQWPHRVEDTTIHDWSSLARYSLRHTLESRLCVPGELNERTNAAGIV